MKDYSKVKKSRAKKEATKSLLKDYAGSTSMWLLMTVILFIVVFSYLSLNLKNIDYGYQLQALHNKEDKLDEEINRLKAEKAALLNLERVEAKVMNELGYQYPEADQFIKVFVDDE